MLSDTKAFQQSNKDLRFYYHRFHGSLIQWRCVLSIIYFVQVFYSIRENYFEHISVITGNYI